MGDGYFAIFACKAGHYVCTDRTHAEILRMIFDRERTAADIAEKMKIKPASVNALMRKFMEDGIVTEHTDPKDSRRMLYHAVGFLVMERTGDTEPIMTTDAVIGELFGDRRSFNWVQHRSIFSSLRELGVDIKPMIRSMGWFFGDTASEKSRENDFIGLTDLLVERFEECGLGDLSITITYFIKVEITGYDTEREIRGGVFEEYCTAIVQRAFERCSGKLMYAVPTGEEDTGCISFELYFKEEEADIMLNPVVLPDLELAKRDTGKFVMYGVNGRAQVMTEPDKIEILAQLEKGTKSIKEIAVALDKSQSTVSADLHELKDEGFVRQVASIDTRKNEFALNGPKLAQSIPPRLEMMAAVRDRAERLIIGEMDYDKSFAETECLLTWLFGIDFSIYLAYMGRKMGEAVADRCKPNDFSALFEELKELFKNKLLTDFSAQITFFTKVVLEKPGVTEDVNFIILLQMMEMTRSALSKNSGKEMAIRNLTKEGTDKITFEVHFTDS